MDLSITTDQLHLCMSEEKALEVYRQIGFKAVDYSYDSHAFYGSCYDRDDYLEYAATLREAADRAGIKIGQMHAPLYHRRIDVAPSEAQKKEEELLEKLTHRAFEVAEVLGCPYMVMHPRKFLHYEKEEVRQEARRYNIAMFRSFDALAKKHHVKIALENMFAYDAATHLPIDTTFQTAEEIVSYIEELNSDSFVACLDTGHAHINGIAPSHMIRVLGKYLKVLHVHDNYQAMDQHLLCGYGTICWEEVLQALRDIDYEGTFSLETISMCERIPVQACLECVRFQYQVVSQLVK